MTKETTKNTLFKIGENLILEKSYTNTGIDAVLQTCLIVNLSIELAEKNGNFRSKLKEFFLNNNAIK